MMIGNGNVAILACFLLLGLASPSCGEKQRAGGRRRYRKRGTLLESNDKLYDGRDLSHDLYGPKEMRFNKFDCVVKNRTLFDTLCPLDGAGYPISDNLRPVSTMLKEQTNAISVVDAAFDIEVNKYILEKLILDVGGLPTHPPSAEFWPHFEKVIDARGINQAEMASVALAEVLPLPDRWENYTVADVAEAVHDEYPGLHQSYFLGDLMEGKYGDVDFDYNVVPKRSNADFLRGIVMLAALNVWSIRTVGPYNFAAKWFAGRCRPEEVAWAITTGELYKEVPHYVRKKIFSLQLSSQENFTAYPEGSPRHPSWPAMHSAASSMSLWLGVVLNLSPEQLCEAKKVDYAVAYARTVAGVHYEDDNIAGLNMGQRIVANELPEYLWYMYGSSFYEVAAKVEESRFGWENFDPKDPCPSAAGTAAAKPPDFPP